MIESIADLGLKELDSKEPDFWEKFDNIIQEKIGINLATIKQSLIDYVTSHAEELSLELPNLTPHGNYAKMIENNDGMTEFLKKEVSDLNLWQVKSVSDHDQYKQLIRFELICTAVDDGETLDGKVFVSKAGVIRHAFVTINA